MKPRRSREINVFNMSMLDVICSALGAFVILILMADFNRSDAVQTVKKLQDEIRHYSKSNKKLAQENAKQANLAKENATLKSEVASLKENEAEHESDKRSSAACQEKLDQARDENKALKEKVERLEADIAQNQTDDANASKTRQKLAQAEEENRALKRENEALKKKVGAGRGSRRNQFTVYGNWRRDRKIYIAGTKVTNTNAYGKCHEKLYTCRRTYQREWCASPNGVSPGGGGGD